MAKVTRTNVLIHAAVERSQEILMWDIKTFENLLFSLNFSTLSQTKRSRSLNQKCWYHRKGLVTRNAHMKCRSFSTHCKKVISKVKFLKSRLNSKVKVWYVGTHSKVLSLYQSSNTHCSKVINELKVFLKVGQTQMSKVTLTSKSRSQRLICRNYGEVARLRNEYSCEISKL